jgi:HD superfamily phosphohydrolase YqeK
MTLPPWAQITPERRAHIERVVQLLGDWAHAMRVSAAVRDRWLRAAWLHDALRDAPAANELAHGPMAADRVAQDGETDRGVLDAVRYHSLGYAGWDDVGRMIYLADYLEPGREFERAERALLAARVPLERDAVLVEVARRRITRALSRGWPLPREAVEFWNDVVGR